MTGFRVECEKEIRSLKTIVLVRHAIAEERETWEGTEFERPLTGKGISKFQKSAAGAAPFLRSVERIISSPYVRASQTAEILSNTIELPYDEEPELACGVDAQDLGDALIAALGDVQCVAYVGHEPDLSTCIQYLLHAPYPPVEVKKGAMTMLEEISPGYFRLLWHLAPKLSRALGE